MSTNVVHRPSAGFRWWGAVGDGRWCH